MQKTSVSAVLEGKRRMSIQEFELPNLKNDDALLRMELVGVCGSDVSLYNEKFGPRPYPIILGHEIVGYIEEAGDKFLKKNGLNIGDRVIVEFSFGCGDCLNCINGKYIACEKSNYYGSRISCAEPPYLWGGYGQYLYLPYKAMVHKISKEMPKETAVLVSAVIANALRWLRQVGNVSIGDTVVIEGVGQQGLAGTAIAKEAGANLVIVTDLSKSIEKFELAKLMGADICINADKDDVEEVIRNITNGNMADILMDVTGNANAAKRSHKLVRKNGTVVLPGLYGSEQEIPIILDEIIRKEVKVLGVFSHDNKAVVPAIKLAEKHNYPWEKIITDFCKLEDAEKAIQLAGGEIEGKNPIKVVIDPWS